MTTHVEAACRSGGFTAARAGAKTPKSHRRCQQFLFGGKHRIPLVVCSFFICSV